MKIGIDARFVGPEGTGLGKYTEKLIQNLAKIDTEDEFVIFLKKSNWDYLTLPENFKKVLADVSWYSVEEQLKMPFVFQRQHLDLLHVPHFNVPIFYRRKFVVTIHDLIHHEFEETSATTKNPILFKIKRIAYKKVIKNAIFASAKIITPSNYVKTQIIKQFKVSPQKIAVTYEASEEEYTKNSKFQNPKSKLLQRYNLRKPFLIYVGNAYPHKNLLNLLHAFSILNTRYQIPDTNLAIVCSRDIFAKRLSKSIQKLALTDRVTLTGYVVAEDLAQIFPQASAYVFPTLSEGFGIPGLNAMSAGVPLVCSNIPTLKEVYEDSALYFDPNDPEEIAEKIANILQNSKLSAELIAKGKAQAKKYSWEKMAQQTLKVYRDTLS